MNAPRANVRSSPPYVLYFGLRRVNLQRRRQRRTRKGKAKAKPKPPPPEVVPSFSTYRSAVSESKESDFVASLLGGMDFIAAKPVAKSRKRKPEPEPAYDGGSSPNPYTSARNSRSNGYGYGSSDPDLSSDAYSDDNLGASSGDEMTSLRKKPKLETLGITPAIDRIAKLEV